MKKKKKSVLFTATREAILCATMMHFQRWWYLSDLARHLRLRPSSLQRELRSLVDGGVLRKRTEGNRVYYQANPKCSYFSELRGIIIKTAGLVDVLREMLKEFQKDIDWAFVYGSIAKAEDRSDSDVDLMIIGNLGLSDLAVKLAKAENKIGREINPTIYSRKEVVKKVKEEHHFIKTVLSEDKILLIGKQDELEKIPE
jgi:predicted nucleotidyltransferase